MSLKYREDSGLAVLALADHGDVERLADLLTYDEIDGNPRIAQELLDEPEFIKARDEGRCGDVWKLVAAELQAFGGNGVVNRIRTLKGEHTGVLYREILDDVAKYLSVDLSNCAGVLECEATLIERMLVVRYSIGKGGAVSPHARSAAREFGRPELFDGTLDVDTLQVRLSDDEAFLFDAISILRRIPQFNLSTSIVGLAGKASWSLPGAVKNLADPALRVTLPAILELARTRRKALRNPLNLPRGQET